MFGRRSEHAYFQCVSCECLQLGKLPDDLGSYYDGGYYSYGMAQPPGWRGWLALQRDRGAIDDSALLGRLIGAFRPTIDLNFLLPLRRTLGNDARILDVGCGSGSLVKRLRRLGFRRAIGVDPYVPAPVVHEGETMVYKVELSSMEGPFDLVMFHHSFEHLPNPVEILNWCRRNLVPASGTCVLRVPLVSSAAWKRYRENWVQLDAPRHLYLHSELSMRKIAAATGFDCHRVVYDSTAFQFWGSEQYARGIPLLDERSYARNPSNSIFTPAQIATWERQSAEVNRSSMGDQACFYFTVMA